VTKKVSRHVFLAGQL